jgi:hypothetical protein
MEEELKRERELSEKAQEHASKEKEDRKSLEELAMKLNQAKEMKRLQDEEEKQEEEALKAQLDLE